ncbi:MAG TPA: YdeI/OmpD-associated family protein [Methylomirabilota bacterium]|nr:YdeI/OmpD-associated family protein [Methylomirabilota bacterium]
MAKISSGVVHTLPKDLQKALSADKAALAVWESLTPLARNEWICWTVSVQQLKTREEHMKRTVAELKEGMRRPCCWLGCVHRKDKLLSPSQKFVLKTKLKK